MSPLFGIPAASYSEGPWHCAPASRRVCLSRRRKLSLYSRSRHCYAPERAYKYIRSRPGASARWPFTLRKALSALGYSLKAHTETPGEMFVYTEGDLETVAAPKRPKPSEVPKVNGVYQHGPECPCEWCEGPGLLRSAGVGSTA
jgi:hypothetical protein